MITSGLVNKIRKFFFHLNVNCIASSMLIPDSLRKMIYKINGIKCDAKQIRSGNFFESNEVEIGRGAFINRNCHFYSNLKIIIGENTYIGMNVLFINATHNIGNSDKRAGMGINYPINVGKGCWIGAKSIILPGVKIGNGCIIGAGSVVNRDCEENGLYAGNPAKRIKELDY